MASMKGYKRSIKLEFDYNEIKDGVPNVKRQMAVLNSEFKKSSSEADASGKSIDKLGVKYDFLSNKIKIQEQEVENYRKKLEAATSAKGNNTKAIENNTASLEIAQAKLGQTKAQLDQVTQELEKQRTTLGKTSEEWKSLSEKTTAIGKDMTLKLTVPILAAATASFKLGADLEQSLGKVETVFGNSAKGIEKWASTAIKDFGLAKSTAIEMAGDFGALFKGMGINLKKTEDWSKTLTERTMDLSNFYNSTVAETTTALNSIVTGQTEPLRKFGINMTQAALQEYALATGIRKKIADMTEAEKVQLRYNFVIERTNIAVGTTARESDTATGQMNRFKEVVKELGTSFSEHVMPIFTPVIKGLSTMAEKIGGLSDGTKKFIVVAGTIVAIVGPTLVILGSLFKALSNISEGMKLAKTGIEAVSKVGKGIGAVLDSATWGFKEWAIAIGAVVLLLTALLIMMDALFNKGRGLDKVVGTFTNAFKNNDIGNAVSGARVRGYAVGTNYINQDQVAMIHKGEAIIPADSNPYNPNATKHGGSGETFNLTLNVDMNEVDDVSKLVKIAKDFKQTKRAGVVIG